MGRATYCLNGHFLDHEPSGEMDTDEDGWPIVSAWEAEWLERKFKRLAYCPKCGSKSAWMCEHCESPIMLSRPNFHRPAYCTFCGKPFPWTVTAIAAAKEYADELELSEDEKTKLKTTFDDLVADTPRTELAIQRFKNFMQRIGPSASSVLTKIMVNVATEAAKKGLGL